AEDHAPALIAPNPVNAGRYVVINSGHTFGADAFRGTNALLYPRLGDYAVFRLGEESGEVAESGYFDEAWKPRAESSMVNGRWLNASAIGHSPSGIRHPFTGPLRPGRAPRCARPATIGRRRARCGGRGCRARRDRGRPPR